MTLEILTALLLLVSMWSISCRVNMMMHGATAPGVFLAHFLCGLGLAGGLFLPGALGKFALAAGVALYLLAGAWRWRYAAPSGTLLQEPADVEANR